MSTVTITLPNSPSSSLVIDTQGASIAGLRLKNRELVWSGTRPDGGKGITHPCIPNFNIAEGLPNHGPDRKEEWKQTSKVIFSWKMQAIADVYPAGLEATRTFQLEENKLTVITTIQNNSNQELPINIAEHHYFTCDVNKRAKVKVNGMLFDKNALNAQAKFSEIGGNELIIEIPDQPSIKLTVNGYSAFAQWSQPDAPFVCVEPIQVMPLYPAKFISDAPKIKPGETKEFRYEVEVR